MSFPIWRIFQVKKRIYCFAHSVMKSFFTSPPGPVNSNFLKIHLRVVLNSQS
jgi:hypothetical protein